MADLDKYYYELKYVDGDKTITHTFSAEIDGTELTNNLRDFLCGCSWSEKQVNNMLGLIGDEE